MFEKKSVVLATKVRPSFADRLEKVAGGRTTSELLRDGLRLLIASEERKRREPPRRAQQA